MLGLPSGQDGVGQLESSALDFALEEFPRSSFSVWAPAYWSTALEIMDNPYSRPDINGTSWNILNHRVHAGQAPRLGQLVTGCSSGV